MPIVQIDLLAGRTKEQKQAMVAAITKTLVEDGKAKSDSVRVIFRDMQKEDYGVNGMLQSEV